MKSLLVALLAHMAGGPEALTAALDPNLPTYAVISLNGNGTYTASASNHFTQTEQMKWTLLHQMVKPSESLIPLCYITTYQGLQSNFSAMRKTAKDTDSYFINAGGNQALSIAAVRWCNASLHKTGFIFRSNPAFKQAELNLRQKAYVDDIAFISSCKGEICKNAPAAFAKATVGIPLESK